MHGHCYKFFSIMSLLDSSWDGSSVLPLAKLGLKHPRSFDHHSDGLSQIQRLRIKLACPLSKSPSKDDALSLPQAPHQPLSQEVIAGGQAALPSSFFPVASSLNMEPPQRREQLFHGLRPPSECKLKPLRKCKLHLRKYKLKVLYQF